MEGYIVNNTGHSLHIFKRKFPARHKMLLKEIWPMYEAKVKAALSKKVVTEEEFVGWLDKRGFMKNGFIYVAPEKTVSEPTTVISASSSKVDEQGILADGRLERPSLAGVSSRVIKKLTYSDIASLRVADQPKNIIFQINNLSKLRRSLTAIRKSGRKAFLEKILRERIQDLERLS